MTWSPAQDLKFEDERSRPAAELLARVPLDAPKRIVDVGCGPGNSTALLAARYPDATLVGLDTSPDMLAAARKRLPKVAFIEASVATWVPDASFDLIFGNAVFQWVPDHLGVLARLLESCQPGGVLAIQVPDNLGEPTHRLMADAALAGPWRNRFEAPVAREAIPTPDAYYDRLRPLAASIDIWRVTYHHVLDGPAAIVEWLKGTGLLPYLERLEAGEREAYLVDYLERIAASHPPLVDSKVLLRFPRLFVVATRG